MEPTLPIFELDLSFLLDLPVYPILFQSDRNYDLYTPYTYIPTRANTHTYTYIHKKSFQSRDRWRNMTPMPLGLFVQKLQPNVGFAYFVVEAKGKTSYFPYKKNYRKSNKMDYILFACVINDFFYNITLLN